MWLIPRFWKIKVFFSVSVEKDAIKIYFQYYSLLLFILHLKWSHILLWCSSIITNIAVKHGCDIEAGLYCNKTGDNESSMTEVK